MPAVAISVLQLRTWGLAPVQRRAVGHPVEKPDALWHTRASVRVGTSPAPNDRAGSTGPRETPVEGLEVQATPRHQTAALSLHWQLIALYVAVYCINLLLPRDLWVQDEARYGEVLREMLVEGGWLVPHLDGFPYPDKPPLYFWIVAAINTLAGNVELAFRLVSVAATGLAAGGVYLVGRELFGVRAGVWAAALFLTVFLTTLVGQIVRMDILLTTATVFAWYALLRWRSEDRSAWLAGFWACTMLAVAIKGPIGLLFTLLPAAVWLAATMGWKGLRGMRPLTGLAVLAAVAGAWVAAVLYSGQADYLDTIWREQLVGRAVRSWSHREPVYFYVLVLPVVLMPWTGVVVRGVLELWRARSPQASSIAAFAALPLAALSLVSGKLFIYLEPLVPALCTAGAVGALQLNRSERVSRWLQWPPVFFGGALAAATGWLAWTRLAEARVSGLAIASGLFLTAVAAGISGRGSGFAWMRAWLLAVVVQSWLLFGALALLINPLFSARELGEQVAHVPLDTAVGVVHTTRGILSYYAGRRLTEVALGEAAAWRQSHPGAVMIVKSSDLAQVFGTGGVPSSCTLDRVFTVELKEYHVVGHC